MENINAILERFTRAEIAATAAQTQTYPEYSGHTDEIFANLATGKFRVIQSVDGYTVSTDPGAMLPPHWGHLVKIISFPLLISVFHLFPLDEHAFALYNTNM